MTAMRFHRLLPSLLLAVTLAAPPTLIAQSRPFAAEAQAIRAVLDKSAQDWNGGDIDAFAKSYKNSPDILFMGTTISRGYTQMLARYKSVFSTRAKMGKLTFAQLEVQPLDAGFATVTGRFHLERDAEGGGNAGGYFLLVVEKTPQGWKIVRDDTTSEPAQAAR
jgi:uncharacterized protein (TIGR02246 family)